MRFKKIDAPQCVAEIKIKNVFVNNETRNFYTAEVIFSEKNTRLFRIKSNVTRLSREDAVKDAINIINENGFSQ